MAAASAIPDLSTPDHTLLLAITTPPDLLPPEYRAKIPAPIHQARFLARPDVQPDLDALQNLADFRDRIHANHLTHKAAQALLHVAEKTDDLVEKRRAATAILHFVHILERGATRTHRRASHTGSDGDCPRPTAPTPNTTAAPAHPPRQTDNAPAHPAPATNGQAAAPMPNPVHTEAEPPLSEARHPPRREVGGATRPDSSDTRASTKPSTRPNTRPAPSTPGRVQTRTERRNKRTSTHDRIRSLTTAAGGVPTLDTG